MEDGSNTDMLTALAEAWLRGAEVGGAGGAEDLAVDWVVGGDANIVVLGARDRDIVACAAQTTCPGIQEMSNSRIARGLAPEQSMLLEGGTQLRLLVLRPQRDDDHVGHSSGHPARAGRA